MTIKQTQYLIEALIAHYTNAIRKIKDNPKNYQEILLETKTGFVLVLYLYLISFLIIRNGLIKEKQMVLIGQNAHKIVIGHMKLCYI